MRAMPVEIEIGNKCYEVGIASGNIWTSKDGSIQREYFEIASPGIYEVVESYLEISGSSKLRMGQHRIVTDAGTVIWDEIAGGVSSRKIDAINDWFQSVLKNQ